MKHLLTILCLSITLLAASAINMDYKKAMKEHLAMLEKADSAIELQEVANGFLRISQLHENEWLPLYYAALSYANSGYISEGEVAEKDAFFDEAEKQLAKAMNLSENNSEIIALKGYILMGKLNASPSTRGQSLSPKVIQAYNHAVQLDEKNPRALILLARMKFGMAQFMGQKPTEACELVGKSDELFKRESKQESTDLLLPSWGSAIVKQMKVFCN